MGRGCPLLGGRGRGGRGSSGSDDSERSLRREGVLGAALPADHAPLLASSSTGSSAFPPPALDGPVLMAHLFPLVGRTCLPSGFTQAQVLSIPRCLPKVRYALELSSELQLIDPAARSPARTATAFASNFQT